MLNGKKLMCLTLLPSLLSMNTLTPPPSSAMQIIEKQVDIKNEVTNLHIKNGLIEEPIEIQIEKDKITYEKQKAEEQKKRELELKKLEEEEKQRKIEDGKNNEPEWREFILTFYSSSIHENSSAGAVTCTGKKLQPYMVANNVYSLGTQIYLDGYGTKIVSDKGSNKHFGTSNRLDVYIEKEPNESYSQYLKRVNSYGVQKVRGYIIK